MNDAERCCALAVARGEKLKFSLIKHGLSYKAKTPAYERMRRLVAQERKRIEKKKTTKAEKRAARFKAKDDNVHQERKTAAAAKHALQQCKERLEAITEDRDKWKNR